MENIALILIILILILIFIGVVSLITLIVMAVAKKNLKIPGMITGASFGSALLLFVVALVISMVATSGESNTSNTTNESTPNTTQSKSTVTTKPKTTSETEEDEEFNKEYDENMAEIRAKREAESDEEKEEVPESESNYQHEVIDDVDVFTSYSEMILTPNVFMSNFSVDMTELLKEKHDEINNGAIFRNATSVTDQHVNEEKMVVVSVWYSQETIEKINYDNWPQLVGEDLYNTADGVLVHHHLEQDTVENKTAGDEQPDAHRYGVGTEYTE